MTETAQIDNFLTRGSEYIKQEDNFKLAGREDDLKMLAKALIRERANSVLLIGRGGVGCSSLCRGLQALKDSADAPVDLITKRFHWLDTDGLFASGDADTITKSFKKALESLSRLPDSVLVIDDMRDFVDAARDNGCTHLINALMREIKNKKFQAIFEVDEADAGRVMTCHSDMTESYTHMDLKEPNPDALKVIVDQVCENSEKHHGIKVSDEAKSEAISLTSKFLVRDMGLSRAQPERTLTLIDRALTTYRWKAHTTNPALDELNARLTSVIAKLDDENYSEDQGGKSRDELEVERAALTTDVSEESAKWEEQQKKVKSTYKDIRLAEDRIGQWEDEIDDLKIKEEKDRQDSIAQNMEQGDEEGMRQASITSFSDKLDDANFETKAVLKLRSQIKEYKGLLVGYKESFDEMTDVINSDLVLTKEHILAEFSAISGVPVDKLSQNEKEKLRTLEANLGNRVWGQEEAVHELAEAIKISKSGLGEDDKPQAAFLYMGPSGVGKTELARALAAEVLGDEKAILRLDMSEYQEKHSVSRLIGAPPGYDGYEDGGILTNAMLANPRRIILLDEIDKAHPDVFLPLLQVLDAARLTDSHGRTVDFSQAIIIMTSNTGKENFTNPDITFEEAKRLALKEIEKGPNDDKGLPGELLNRLGGREDIICFRALDIPVIEKIAKRELDKLDAKIRQKKPGLSLSYDDDEIKEMCIEHYSPVEGARGIVGFIKKHIKKSVANTLLFDDSAAGVMEIEYDADKKGVIVHPAVQEEKKTLTPVTPLLDVTREFSNT